MFCTGKDWIFKAADTRWHINISNHSSKMLAALNTLGYRSVAEWSEKYWDQMPCIQVQIRESKYGQLPCSRSLISKILSTRSMQTCQLHLQVISYQTCYMYTDSMNTGLQLIHTRNPHNLLGSSALDRQLKRHLICEYCISGYIKH